MNVIVFGPPGSGKGTQAERLRDNLLLRHISTGELLRGAVAARTELGRSVEKIMASGELVSDEIVLELIRDAVDGVKKNPDWNGWLLDGFPRTAGQAAGLDRLLAEREQGIDAIVVLEVGRGEIIARLTRRGRDDDTAETVNNRLDVYEARTRPTLDYYEGRVTIHRIDGARSVDAVAADIEGALR